MIVPTVEEILSVTPESFDALSERVLAYQRTHNPVYGRFAQAGSHLPVAAFKVGTLTTFPPQESEAVFRSSGTSASGRAVHYVRDLAWYETVVVAGFRRVFGGGPFRFAFHLPRYAVDSSLVHMATTLIRDLGVQGSGFFLEDVDMLRKAVEDPGEATLVLFGAAFGLLDLMEKSDWALPDNSVIVETGGMKTHRRAIGRQTLHRRLAEGFRVRPDQIFSEYGMCEMMSQCYSEGGGLYKAPPWVAVSVRDPQAPERELPAGEPGVLAVTDLANLHSASALLTQDRAVMHTTGFEVLGRLSGAELRGCNFLLEQG